MPAYSSMMKQYKIIRIAGLHYKTAIETLYSQTSNLQQNTYAEQQKKIFQEAYTYSDSFSRGMRLLGHDASEIIYDVEPLQKTWADEHQIRYHPSHWQWDILLAQIEKMRPDVLYFQDLHSLPYSLRKDLRSRFPFLKLVVIFRGFPGISEKLFQELATADILLVGSPILVDKCCQAGLHPHLVYHYFDETILKKISQISQPLYDFTFIGSSGYGYAAHEPRYRFLLELLENNLLEAWIDEKGLENFRTPYQMIRNEFCKNIKSILRSIPQPALGRIASSKILPSFMKNTLTKIANEDRSGFPITPLIDRYPNKCHSGVFGVKMYELLSRSKLTFNKHSAPAAGTVDNIRLFQATGVGACLLTDSGSNIHQLFDTDSEIVVYRSVEECVEKAEYLLSHDSVRKSIAQAGQRRTLKDHSFRQRCRQIDEILQNALGR